MNRHLLTQFDTYSDSLIGVKPKHSKPSAKKPCPKIVDSNGTIDSIEKLVALKDELDKDTDISKAQKMTYLKEGFKDYFSKYKDQ
jgi:hypothetical protein